MKTIINSIQQRHDNGEELLNYSLPVLRNDRGILLDIIRDITEYMKDATFHRAEIMEIINRTEP